MPRSRHHPEQGADGAGSGEGKALLVTHFFLLVCESKARLLGLVLVLDWFGFGRVLALGLVFGSDRSFPPASRKGCVVHGQKTMANKQ